MVRSESEEGINNILPSIFTIGHVNNLQRSNKGRRMT